jgi:hypothetical protein
MFTNNDAKLIGKFEAAKYIKSLDVQYPQPKQLFLVKDEVYRATTTFYNNRYYILTEKPKTTFKVGDKVYADAFGWGTVDEIDTHPKFPVNVRFERDLVIKSFDVEGYYNWDKNPYERISKNPKGMVLSSCFDAPYKHIPYEPKPSTTQYVNVYRTRMDARHACTGKEIQSVIRRELCSF